MSVQLPTYALYGERGRSIGTDWLHLESIAERSRRHDWEIRPHRHELLLQILVVERGEAEALLEGRALALAAPCAVTVPPLAAHGFRFAPSVEGSVVTVLERHCAALLAGEPALRERLARAQAVELRGAAAPAVLDALAALRREFAGTGGWRALGIDVALLRLAVELARAAPEPAPAGAEPGARALAHVRRFRELVEARFREQPPLPELAAALGITPTQLNRVCRQVLGHGALDVLHARLLLEAQRDLAYTTLSVKQIAHGIGFADAAYFTRFFQRLTGRSPTAWRASAGR